MDATPEEAFRRWTEHGDGLALGRAFDACAPELAGLAAHLARDAENARDLVQETFLVALERARTWDPQRPLMPWLVGILTLCARGQRRRLGRFPDPRRLLSREPERPEEALQRGELVRTVGRALERLPEAYRDALFAHLVEGLAPREIAARSGEAPGTVRVRLHRGFGMLRERLPAGLAGAVVLPPNQLAGVRETLLRTALRPARGATWRLALALPAVGVLVGVIALRDPSGAHADRQSDLLTEGNAPVELQTALHPDPVIPLEGRVESAGEGAGASGSGRTRAASRRRADVDSAAEEEAPADARPLLLLIGTVRGAADFVVQAPVVHVERIEDHQRLGCTCAQDGSFQLDLTPLLVPDSGLEDFALHVDHPDLLPLHRGLQERARLGRVSSGTLDLGNLILDSPRVVLNPRLADGGRADWGVFARGKATARILLDQALDQAAPKLRLPWSGDYELVVRRGEASPTVLPLKVSAHDPPDLSQLELLAGQTVEGTVALPMDVSGEGSSLVLVSRNLAFALQRNPDAVVRWNGLGFDGETWEPLQRRAPLHHGRFRLDGLAPLDRVARLEGVAGYALHHPLGPMDLGAADTYLHLTPPLARVDLRLLDRDRPVSGASLEVDGVSLPSHSDAAGWITALVPADRPLVWRALAEGYVVRDVQRVGPPPGAAARWTELLEPRADGEPEPGEEGDREQVRAIEGARSAPDDAEDRAHGGVAGG